MQEMQNDEDQVDLGNARLHDVLQQYMLPSLTASALAHLQAACQSTRHLVAEASLACWATAAAGACPPPSPGAPFPPFVRGAACRQLLLQLPQLTQ